MSDIFKLVVKDSHFYDEITGLEFHEFRDQNPWEGYVVLNPAWAKNNRIVQVGGTSEWQYPVLVEGNTFYRVEPSQITEEMHRHPVGYTYNPETGIIEEWVEPVKASRTKEDILADLDRLREELLNTKE